MHVSTGPMQITREAEAGMLDDIWVKRGITNFFSQPKTRATRSCCYKDQHLEAVLANRAPQTDALCLGTTPEPKLTNPLELILN